MSTPSILYGGNLGSLTITEVKAQPNGSELWINSDNENVMIIELEDTMRFYSFNDLATIFNEVSGSSIYWVYDAVDNRFVGYTTQVGSTSFISYGTIGGNHLGNLPTLLCLTEATSATIVQGQDGTPLPNPVFSLPGGAYSGAQTLTLTSPSGDPIYYTLDNTTPTQGSILYTGPITINTTGSVQAIVISSTNRSGIAINYYTITNGMPPGPPFGPVVVTNQIGLQGMIELSYSDDGGNTFNNSRYCTTGAVGEYKRRIIFRRLGQSRDRVFAISGTCPVAHTVIGIQLDIEEGNS